MQVVSTREVQPGQQLLLSYLPPGASNDAFCLHYGWVPHWNPHDEVQVGGAGRGCSWGCCGGAHPTRP